MQASRNAVVRSLVIALLVGAAATAGAQTVINQTKAEQGLGGCDAAGFPVTLCIAGSYRLTSNLLPPNASQTAVRITTNFVTLDLNGFAIRGPGTAGAGKGVLTAADVIGTTILNGSVSFMGGDGLDLHNGGQGRVERVTAFRNGGNGIRVGANSIIRDNIAGFNGAHGILAGDGSTISGNTADGNGTSEVSSGIAVDQGSTVLGNTARANRVSGLLLFGFNSGYGQNVLSANTQSAVNGTGATSMGDNVCDGAPC